MNDKQIEAMLASCLFTKRHFRGVFPSDKIPTVRKLGRKPLGFVCNLDPSNKAGSHWVAFYFPGGKNGTPEYFDSYGRKASLPSFKRKLGRKYLHNPLVLQSPFSVVCGQYCIYFLLKRAKGVPYRKILASFDPKDPEGNDFAVNEFIETHFDIDLSVYDFDYLGKQIAKALSKQ